MKQQWTEMTERCFFLLGQLSDNMILIKVWPTTAVPC